MPTVILRNTSKGFRGLCPKATFADITLDPGEVVEVNLDKAELEDALKTGWFEVVKKPISTRKAGAKAPAAAPKAKASQKE